ncbi:hypothetical protein EX895_006432 [Sporisorium graminicola]|uniref:Uncharacterized protein n=1 Tax=Sporisorium graminicola TaxID=280036 RepID=A0A4U7KKG5_9BASI|nr:hypothetical protein EX895_006432 [Sporisorium graminicola]TKY84530.1 hypothetical protein EX895_006432 [Sporisorium graminicola]
MLSSASTSTASTSLLSSATGEGLKHLYRTILQQARLLSHTLDDPVVFSSHRFLARKNLEPLLSDPLPLIEAVAERQWPPPTATKRVLRAQMHRRHLADANYGWEHSVRRALWLAYARKGKLRRDALSDLSPVASSSVEEQKYEKRLRKREFSPVLQTLLTNSASMNGASVKSRDHLTGRPPPPFLPGEDDPLVKYFGKAMGRRRVVNAQGKFVKAYLKKVLVPVDVISSTNGGWEEGLFAHLESKARPPKEHVAGYPRRFNAVVPHLRTPRESAPAHTTQSLPWLASAAQSIPLYRSDLNPSAHRKRTLRVHGWTSHPKDFNRPRLRRRLYAKLLDDAPLLLLLDVDSTLKADESSRTRRKKNNDPLGIRAKIEPCVQIDGRAKMKLVKSRFAVGPRSRGAEVAPRQERDGEERVLEGLHASEVAFLRERGWVL